MHLPADAVAGLSREPTELTELHCILVRVAALERTAPFDESLVAGREEAHLSLALAAAGTTIWLEPSVVVGYPDAEASPPLGPVVLPGSVERRVGRPRRSTRSTPSGVSTTRRSTTSSSADTWSTESGTWPATTSGWRNRADQLAWKRRRAVDVVATPLAARAQDRRRAKAPPPRVVHRASWDVADQVGANRQGHSRRADVDHRCAVTTTRPGRESRRCRCRPGGGCGGRSGS